MPPMGSPLFIIPLMVLQLALAPFLDLSNYLGTLSTLWLIPIGLFSAIYYEVKLEALCAYCLTWIIWYILLW